MNAIKFLMICAGMTGAAAAATAQEIEVRGAVPTVEVRFADLDLGSFQGREALDGRLRAAARRLCQPATVGPLEEKMARRACYRTALGGARGRVERILAEYNRTRMAGRASVTVAAR